MAHTAAVRMDRRSGARGIWSANGPVYFDNDEEAGVRIPFYGPKQLLLRLSKLAKDSRKSRNAIMVRFIETGIAMFECMEHHEAKLKGLKRDDESIDEFLVRLVLTGADAARHKDR